MNETIGYDQLRQAAVRQVAQLMAAAAITAPKSGGQLFLAGKPGFMETVIIAQLPHGGPGRQDRLEGLAPANRVTGLIADQLR